MTADKPSPSSTGVGAASRTHKSCDACKSRKVRCPSNGPPGPCANCIRRKEECRFSVKRLAHRRNGKHEQRNTRHTIVTHSEEQTQQLWTTFYGKRLQITK
ncbi:hypothetical protein BDP55DRAFT_664560 [Colletotrichum godetiae]|uniref:Zn(2)-C6 fungal-type domain-containing protein n=1 Tax=Colletotrichum godetiae TaxID=1209918 RepID=A0AAJ0APS9_9PEZI|nr:uncharacterized protein BDP55DRAFT_664560 [Colletotrichum godetiae]KAK1675586.1 hypothetical protein BDP55DRAFT_664560 [Colletotrichum godetiae]